MRPRDVADKVDWLCLIRSENVGPATFYGLIKRYGTAGAAVEALPELAAGGGLRRPIRIATPAMIDRELEVAERLKVRHIFLGDAEYPPALASIHAPPPVITLRGDVALLTREPIAIVGSRKASSAGRTMARRLAEAFGDAGCVVVSGLALGIDAEAHRASLASGTVAVVAGGVDKPTPQENAALADEIVARGAMISEMPLGAVPFARDFPRRNRIIAGLCRAVVVVEAAAASGSLHTARFASDENREVFAVPGSPLDPRAAGCLALIRDGATMVIEPDDVLANLGGAMRAVPVGFEETVAPDEEFAHGTAQPDALAKVTEALSVTPMPVDAIVRATGLPTGEVMAAIVELELAGKAEREPSGAVRRPIRR